MITNELQLLAVLAVTLFGILLFLLLYLTVRKMIDIKKRIAIESFKEKYAPMILNMLYEGSNTRGLNPSSRAQFQAIEELLGRYSKVLEGEAEKQRLSELAAMHLTSYYRERLYSKKWSSRMNALYHIEDFRIIAMREDVRRLIDNKRISYEELIHGLRILAYSEQPDLLELLTGKFTHLSVLDLSTVLIGLENKQFNQFLLHFHKSRPALQQAILQVISAKKEISYLPFVENIFSVYRGEVRLSALKALAEIGYVENADPFLELLYSSMWEERMVAAKLIGSLREEKGIPRLVELMHDRIWWVRSQAGRAISQFANGKEILQSVLDKSTDPFAKDMAWEWLNKGG
jgi:hypothetical protein